MSHEGSKSTSLLRINSRYRTSDSLSNTDFAVEFLPSQISDSVTRVALTRASFLYLFPNIDHWNRSLLLTDGAGAEHITVLPIGQYTVEQICTILNDVASPTSAFIQFRFDAASRYIFVTPLATFTLIGDDERRNPLARLLGFGLNIGQFSARPEFSQPLVPDLSGPQSVFIESPTLAHANCIDSAGALGGGYLSLLDIVPLAMTPYGHVINWQANDLASSDIDYTTAQSLRRVHIRLTDGHNHILSLPINQEVELVLKLWYN